MNILKNSLVIGTLALSGLATNVFAQGYAREQISRIEYAPVVSAEPIYRTVEQRVPVENCWTEQVREETPVYQEAGHRPKGSATGTVLGAIIGGGLGHAVGAGDENKKVGAAIGAVLGASVGHDIARRRAQRNYQPAYDSYSQTSYRDVRRCEVEERVETQQITSGYRVSYRYQGKTYHTRTDRHPGDRIKLAVSIEPLE